MNGMSSTTEATMGRSREGGRFQVDSQSLQPAEAAITVRSSSNPAGILP